MVARWRAGRKKRARGRYSSLLTPFDGPLRLVSSPVIRISHSPFLCYQSAKIWVYDQLSLRRTPLGPIGVCLRVMSAL